MRKNKKFNLILIFLLITALLSATFFTVYAVTEEEKAAAEKAAKEAAERADAKKKEAKETAKKAAAAVANFEEAEKKLESLQGEIEATQGQIESTKADIAAKEAEIEAKEAEMKAKEEEIQEQNDALNNRLTAMYKTGNASFVDVVLNSEDISDLLNNIGMVHTILESDQDLLEKLQDDYEELAQMKEDLESEKQDLENYKIALEDQEIALEAKQVETEELKKIYKAEADKLHAMQEQKEAEAAAMAAEAAAKQAEAERMIVESGGQIKLTPGKYAWPVASNWVQTDNYGWRICPFHGREYHNGLDLVLSSGTMGAPVYAISDGVITKAAWYGGYGNCITYAIGGGCTVLYGHLSGFNCSEGQFVKKGQVLGYIGSTGASTGAHLHFTVFQGENTINPYSLY